jgi:hypothetical protein
MILYLFGDSKRISNREIKKSQCVKIFEKRSMKKRRNSVKISFLDWLKKAIENTACGHVAMTMLRIMTKTRNAPIAYDFDKTSQYTKKGVNLRALLL